MKCRIVENNSVYGTINHPSLPVENMQQVNDRLLQTWGVSSLVDLKPGESTTVYVNDVISLTVYLAPDQVVEQGE